jgi:chromatin remodeling complex protein RSC6
VFQRVAGVEKASRPDVVRLAWTYIKDKNLKGEKGFITLDALLGEAAGKPAGSTIKTTELFGVIAKNVTDPTPKVVKVAVPRAKKAAADATP